MTNETDCTVGYATADGAMGALGVNADLEGACDETVIWECELSASDGCIPAQIGCHGQSVHAVAKFSVGYDSGYLLPPTLSAMSFTGKR
jgi:hypothetical protein